MFLRLTHVGICTATLLALSVCVGCRDQGPQAAPGPGSTIGVPATHSACPITGTPVEPPAPQNLRWTYVGQTIALNGQRCCETWDRLGEKSQAEELSKVMNER